MVFLIPFNVRRHEGSLGVHMRFVLARIRVEEAHERAVRDESTMPCASYLKAFRPPIQRRTMMRPMRVTTTPARSARAAISKMRVIMLGTVLRLGSAWVIVWFITVLPV